MKYKVAILSDENYANRYEVFVGLCKESSKELTNAERLKRYFEIQTLTGRTIERVIVSGINGQRVEAGELEIEINKKFAKSK